LHVQRLITVFDAADIAAESAFWAGLLGGEVDAGDDWHSISIDGEWALAVQLAPDHVPPQWPDGASQQMHLDVWVEDLAEAHEKAIGLGASLLMPANDPKAPEGWQVYADPAGHPFCLCWHKR
jgi:hypothetical protein